MARKLDAAGIRIGIGTDLVVGWYRFLSEPYLQKLRNYRLLDKTAAQALIAATRTNAEIFGMPDRLGDLQPGKLADLVIIAGQPDVDLEDQCKVEQVVVNGCGVVRDGRVQIPRHIEEKAPCATAPVY